MPEYKTDEHLRKETAARIWLSYYNRVLYEKGIISQREHSKMELKISNWKISMT